MNPKARSNLQACLTTTDTVILVHKRWSAKFGQVDKGKVCLKAAKMPQIRSEHGKTNTPDPFPGLQGKSGAGGPVMTDGSQTSLPRGTFGRRYAGFLFQSAAQAQDGYCGDFV